MSAEYRELEEKYIRERYRFKGWRVWRTRRNGERVMNNGFSLEAARHVASYLRRETTDYDVKIVRVYRK